MKTVLITLILVDPLILIKEHADRLYAKE